MIEGAADLVPTDRGVSILLNLARQVEVAVLKRLEHIRLLLNPPADERSGFKQVGHGLEP